jgi:hypothetical protein
MEDIIDQLTYELEDRDWGFGAKMKKIIESIFVPAAGLFFFMFLKLREQGLKLLLALIP